MTMILDGTTGYITFNDGTTQQTAAYLTGTNCVYENNQVIASNYTMTTNRNGFSVGPITVNSGITVTVSPGSRWVVA
jgi:hypothetical protein